MNSKQMFFIAVAISCLIIPTQAQKTATFRVGVESAILFFGYSPNNKWDIRQDISRYDNYSNGSATLGELNYSYFGIKPEISLLKDRLNIYSGLRLITLSGSAERGSNSFFYLRSFNSDGTHFYMVRSIREKLSYLSVPLEIAYTMAKWKRFAMYVKGGAQIGFKVYDKSALSFMNSDMKEYEREIIANRGFKNNSILSNAYSSFGIRFITRNQMHINLEVICPAMHLTENNGGLWEFEKDAGGGGFQISVQFPLYNYSR